MQSHRSSLSTIGADNLPAAAAIDELSAEEDVTAVTDDNECAVAARSMGGKGPALHHHHHNDDALDNDDHHDHIYDDDGARNSPQLSQRPSLVSTQISQSSLFISSSSIAAATHAPDSSDGSKSKRQRPSCIVELSDGSCATDNAVEDDDLEEKKAASVLRDAESSAHAKPLSPQRLRRVARGIIDAAIEAKEQDKRRALKHARSRGDAKAIAVLDMWRPMSTRKLSAASSAGADENTKYSNDDGDGDDCMELAVERDDSLKSDGEQSFAFDDLVGGDPSFSAGADTAKPRNNNEDKNDHYRSSHDMSALQDSWGAFNDPVPLLASRSGRNFRYSGGSGGAQHHDYADEIDSGSFVDDAREDDESMGHSSSPLGDDGVDDGEVPLKAEESDPLSLRRGSNESKESCDRSTSSHRRGGIAQIGGSSLIEGSCKLSLQDSTSMSAEEDDPPSRPCPPGVVAARRSTDGGVESDDDSLADDLAQLNASFPVNRNYAPSSFPTEIRLEAAGIPTRPTRRSMESRQSRRPSQFNLQASVQEARKSIRVSSSEAQRNRKLILDLSKSCSDLPSSPRGTRPSTTRAYFSRSHTTHVEDEAKSPQSDEEEYGSDYTGLRELCNTPMLLGRIDRNWTRVRDYLEGLSNDMAKIAVEAKEGSENETALHLACSQKPPADVIKMLLQRSPLPARWKTKSQQWLPLHFECSRGPNAAVVKLLVDVFPESVNAVDSEGRTPLHLARYNDIARPTFESLRLLMNTESINSKANDGSYPVSIQYLAECARKISIDDADEIRYGKECLQVFLDAKLIQNRRPGQRGAVQFIATLEDSPSWFEEHALMHPCVQAILNWRITDPFLSMILMLDFYVLAMLIIFFRISAFKALEARSTYRVMAEEFEKHGTHEEALESFATAIGGIWSPTVPLYVGVIYLLSREVLQLVSIIHRGDIGSWLFDVENWLDCLCISMVFKSTLHMHLGTGVDDDLRFYIVATTGVLWMMMLSYLKHAKRECSVFVTAVLQVTMALRSFLLTLGIFFAAFAQMYFTDVQGTTTCNFAGTLPFLNVADDDGRSHHPVENDFCTLSGSFLKVYMMLTGGGIEENDYLQTTTSLWLSIIFSFLVIILLLNVLIAIVTDSYQEVKNRGEAVFWSNRLSFVFEVDQIGVLINDVRLPFVMNVKKDKGTDESIPFGASLTLTRWAFARNATSDRSSDEKKAGQTRHDSAEHFLSNTAKILWSIMCVAYQDPSDYSVYKRKAYLEKQFAGKGPVWFLGPVVNPLVSPHLAKPSHSRRLAFLILIPLWLILGIFSAGFLWPPQVKKWLFCATSAHDEKGGSNAASVDDVETLRREVKDEVRRVEALVDSKLDGIRSKVEDMKDDLQEKMTSILDMLTDVSLAVAE